MVPPDADPSAGTARGHRHRSMPPLSYTPRIEHRMTGCRDRLAYRDNR